MFSVFQRASFVPNTVGKPGRMAVITESVAENKGKIVRLISFDPSAHSFIYGYGKWRVEGDLRNQHGVPIDEVSDKQIMLLHESVQLIRG